MKDENGLHFLGWMILAHVVENNWLALFATVIAIGYSFAGIYSMWKNRK